jgi:nucleoside-diphosphate-sugar epimerase
MTVLVFGGSGPMGRFLLPRLLASGESVISVSRHAQHEPADVTWLRGELPDAVPAVPALSAIISFGPLQHFADWLAHAPLTDAPRVIAISSMSAETKRDSSVPAERDISRQLCAGEAALASACMRHGCGWTVLRPTLIYGAGLDKSLTPIARRASRLRVFPLPAGKGLRQPVHADDIAQAVLAALDCPAATGRILPIGGGERLSVHDMFSRVRRSLPNATLPLPLPTWLLQLCRHASPRWRGPLNRLEADLVADNGELQRLLGIRPRPFQPESSMWIAPGR